MLSGVIVTSTDCDRGAVKEALLIPSTGPIFFCVKKTIRRTQEKGRYQNVQCKFEINGPRIKNVTS